MSTENPDVDCDGIDPRIRPFLEADRVDTSEKLDGHEDWPIEGEISSEDLDDFIMLLQAIAWDFFVRRGITTNHRAAMFSVPENESVHLQVWSLIGVDNRRACSLLLGELESILDFPTGSLRSGGLEAGLQQLEHWFDDGCFVYNRHPTTPRPMTADEMSAAPKRLFQLSNILQLPPVVPTERLGNIQVLIAVGFVFVGCYGCTYWPHQLVDSEVLEGCGHGTRVLLKPASLLRVLSRVTDNFRELPPEETWSNFVHRRGWHRVSHEGRMYWVPSSL